MMTEETQFLKAQEQFQDLCELMRQAGREGWRMDEIERRAKPKLMRLGLEFLAGHVESEGTGDVGPEVAYDNRTLNRSQELHSRRYLSIFGELLIERYISAVREHRAAEVAAQPLQLVDRGLHGGLANDPDQRGGRSQRVHRAVLAFQTVVARLEGLVHHGNPLGAAVVVGTVAAVPLEERLIPGAQCASKQP